MTILFHVAKSSFEQLVQSEASDLYTSFTNDYMVSAEFHKQKQASLWKWQW